MFHTFDDMFDFDHNGRLDACERAAQLQFLDDMEKDEENEDGSSWEDTDELEEAGLDRDDLEFMDEDERREALEDAGLDPDDYDF